MSSATFPSSVDTADALTAAAPLMLLTLRLVAMDTEEIVLMLSPDATIFSICGAVGPPPVCLASITDPY